MGRAKAKPLIDLAAVLNEPVKVRVGNEIRTLSPYEAEMEQCAAKALAGNITACRRFILACISQSIIDKPEVVDDWDYHLIIPPDWTTEEYYEKFAKFGPPPWPGKRDGLTDAARKKRKANRRKGR